MEVINNLTSIFCKLEKNLKKYKKSVDIDN